MEEGIWPFCWRRVGDDYTTVGKLVAWSHRNPNLDPQDSHLQSDNLNSGCVDAVPASPQKPEPLHQFGCELSGHPTPSGTNKQHAERKYILVFCGVIM